MDNERDRCPLCQQPGRRLGALPTDHESTLSRQNSFGDSFKTGPASGEGLFKRDGYFLITI